MKSVVVSLFIGAITIGLTAQAADDPEKIFKEVIELLEDGDTEAALAEAKWGVERLEQLRQDKVSDVFPDEIGDYKGNSLSKNKAMGVMITERIYSHKGVQISVKLTEGTSGGGALAGFGALAQMAGAMGGGRKIRIQRRTGTAMSEGKNSTINIGLESGGSLMFQTNDIDIDSLIEFAESFPVAKLDEARGS